MNEEQQIITCREALAAEIQTRCMGDRWHLIAIDGFSGAGKTKLAEHVATAIGARHIKTDEFVEQNELGRYLRYLAYPSLAESIKSCEATCKTLLLDGVCIQEVLARLGFQSDIHVYVKRVGWDGSWKDSPLIRFKTLAESLVNVENMSAKELKSEVLEYHYKYQPHKSAAIIYERHEN